jgi:putative transposase
MSVLIDLKNRGVSDTFFVVCDGLKGHPRGRVERVAAGDRADTRHPPDSEHVRRSPPASTPTSSREDLRPIYTAVNATAARAAFDDLAEKWGQRYPAVIRLWTTPGRRTWAFLDYDVEIRTVICSTNAIESFNARYRRAVKARGHLPNELAALKCLYLVTRSLDPTGAGRARWTMRWKPALNAFAITFADRFPAAETY